MRDNSRHGRHGPAPGQTSTRHRPTASSNVGLESATHLELPDHAQLGVIADRADQPIASGRDAHLEPPPLAGEERANAAERAFPVAHIEVVRKRSDVVEGEAQPWRGAVDDDALGVERVLIGLELQLSSGRDGCRVAGVVAIAAARQGRDGPRRVPGLTASRAADNMPAP